MSHYSHFFVTYTILIKTPYTTSCICLFEAVVCSSFYSACLPLFVHNFLLYIVSMYILCLYRFQCSCVKWPCHFLLFMCSCFPSLSFLFFWWYLCMLYKCVLLALLSIDVPSYCNICICMCLLSCIIRVWCPA